MKNSIYSISMTSMVVALASYIVACTPVQFSKIQDSSGGTPDHKVGPTTCQSGTCIQHHTDTKYSGTNRADLLFVIDNSGSMSDVQQNIASKFGSLLSKLSGIDYHIGIITTDVSSAVSDTVNNPSGKTVFGVPFYQDGKFVPFTNGASFLTSSDTNAQSIFGSTIQRKETINCENPPAYSGIAAYSDDYCASQEPRAIYASILALKNTTNGFFRSDAPLALVIVSDADERGGNGGPNAARTDENGSTDVRTLYPLGTNDQPSTLVSTLNSVYPGKGIETHALVIKPGDTACYQTRANKSGRPSSVFGFYANTYSNLVSTTGGVLGSVCASDYSSELGQIGTAVQYQIQSISFACSPKSGQYQLQFIDSSTGNTVNGINYTPDLSHLVIQLTSPLPANVKAVLDYDCQV